MDDGRGDDNIDLGIAAASDGDDVSQGSPLQGRNHSETMGKSRQRTFPLRIEQALCGQFLLQLLKGKMEESLSRREDLLYIQLIISVRRVDADPACRHDLKSIAEGKRDCLSIAAKQDAAQARLGILEGEGRAARGGVEPVVLGGVAGLGAVAAMVELAERMGKSPVVVNDVPGFIGNLLITPPANIGLIDFGLTGRVDDEMLGYLVVGLVGAFNREAELIVEVLAEMNALGDDTDRRQLRRGLLELIDKYYGLPLHRFNPQTMLYEITGLMRQHNVTLPREFVMLAKSLVGVGGICLQLDPDLDLLALVGPRLRGIMARRLTPRRLLRSTGLAGWHLTNLLKSAPGQLRDVARRLALGKWQVNIRHQNLDHLATEIDRSSNRLSFAMIIAAVIVGSSMILSTPGTVKFADLELPLRVFGIVGYIVAGLMGMGLAVSIWRSGRL